MELLYTIPAAVGLGALHSLEPGHGKGIITAYLVSSGAKIKDAILIGIISALAHTLSISLLAFSASSTVKFLFPENLTNWLQLISGIIVIYIGLTMIIQRIIPTKSITAKKSSYSHQHGCDHHHENQEHCNHTHVKLNLKPTTSPFRDLFLIGFFTGLVPCPSALAILLAAIAANQIPIGLGLVGAFSAGGAITMVTIGLIVIRASSSLKQLEKRHIMNRLTLVSSCLILVLGAAVILQSVSRLE